MAASLDIFRALGDPTRLRIIHLLRAMELAVGEIAQVVGQSQPRVSRHVRILAEAGLVERRKEGNWVFLRLGKGEGLAPFIALFDHLTPSDAEKLWQQADLARLAAVRGLHLFPILGTFNACAKPGDKVPFSHQIVCWFSGLRGGVAFALARSQLRVQVRRPGTPEHVGLADHRLWLKHLLCP